LITTLIKSDVSKYVTFRMLDSVSVWDEEHAGERGRGGLRKVPGSKEEVFKDKSVGLVEKRKLMKFLMFAGGEFEQSDIMAGEL
jgi:RAB protein geranylgeranyltransferase component A